MGSNRPLTRRAAFLDRDGVINKAIVREGRPYPPARLSELEVLPQVAQSLERLRRAGFLSIVVTNQPDVARGAASRDEVEAMHERLRAELSIDAIYACWHDDKDRCACRKPLPGLLYQAARDYDVDLNGSFMIGDRWRDIEAGQRAGCRTVWINRRYREQAPVGADYEVDGLPAAVDYILKGVASNEKR
jgi:D-glycero-D-manno-heptose 1,7-bisphosphate phosphatase